MPAVSISRKGYRFPSRPLKSNGSSIASRVVPARSLTIRRSLRRSLLASEDLPTFGRPMKLMQMGPAASCRRALPLGPEPARRRGADPLQDRLAQLALAAAVLGGHEDRLPQSEARDPLVVRLLVPEIGLVDDEDHRLAAPAQALRDPVV